MHLLHTGKNKWPTSTAWFYGIYGKPCCLWILQLRVLWIVPTNHTLLNPTRQGLIVISLEDKKEHALKTKELRWRHNCTMASQITSLLNRLFRRRSEKHQNSASLAFVRGIHRWPVNSPPVIMGKAVYTIRYPVLLLWIVRAAYG